MRYLELRIYFSDITRILCFLQSQKRYQRYSEEIKQLEFSHRVLRVIRKLAHLISSF